MTDKRAEARIHKELLKILLLLELTGLLQEQLYLMEKKTLNVNTCKKIASIYFVEN